MTEPREVVHMLIQRAEALCCELLPNGRRAGAEWEVGSVLGEPGRSLKVRLYGSKAGVWCDFATGEKGNLIGLIAAVLRLDREEAWAWVHAWLGLNSEALPERRSRPRRADHALRHDRDKQDRIGRARRIWEGAWPAAGTLAERYLHARGIRIDLPASLRFHPRLWHEIARRPFPALVAAVETPTRVSGAVRGAGFEITGVWRIYLREDGRGKAPVPTPKLGLGPVRGGAVRLKPPVRRVAIAEGLETALSVAAACPEITVWAALSAGGLEALRLPRGVAEVIVLADADPPGLEAAARAVRRFKRAGLKSACAVPPKAGADFNDMLRKE